MTGPTRTSDSGTTIIEALMVVVVLAVLMALMTRTEVGMSKAQQAGTTKSAMHRACSAALGAIVADLRRSAFTTVGGKDFPYVFDDGAAVAPFESHAHAPASSDAEPGDEDFGPNREVVLVVPADANEDGVPDIVNNAVVWSADEVSYTVQTRKAGNYLVRTAGGTQRKIARHVERLVVDTPESSGFTIPTGSVRVRLFLRRRDSDGVWHRHASEVTVRLQVPQTP